MIRPGLRRLRVPGQSQAGSNSPGWVLQSVLISPERRYAIINDEVVALGGSIAGAELVAVAEERVTLRTQEGLRIVRLYPDVTQTGRWRYQPGAKPSAVPRRGREKAQKPRDLATPERRNE